MYNLLVSADDEAWQGQPYALSRGRVFEYTEDAISARFKDFTEAQLQHLYALPAIFAYESFIGQDARLGRVRAVRIQRGEVRIEYELFEEAPAIPLNLLIQEANALDIGDWELNRTHWAVKDVDLAAFLERHGIVGLSAQENEIANEPLERLPVAEPIPIQPTVFRIPQAPVDPALVAVMMPFTPDFEPMLAEVRRTCHELGLNCLTAGQVWENEEIIQDIFSLIYRARVVLCDFTGQNANVFYEAGIAHTLGKTVIPIAQSMADLPFDLRHHRAAVYENTADGLGRLTAQLRPRFQWLMEHG